MGTIPEKLYLTTTIAPLTDDTSSVSKETRASLSNDHKVSNLSSKRNLNLETARLPAATGALELAAFALDLGAGGAVLGTGGTEVAGGNTGSAATPQQDGVLTTRPEEGKLIEGKSLTAGLGKPGAGTLSETKGGNLELGVSKTVESDIISDSADNDGDLVLLALHVPGNASKTHGGPVDAGHYQSLEDNPVETRLGTTRKESIKLGEEVDVDVLGLRVLPVLVANLAAAVEKVYTHFV